MKHSLKQLKRTLCFGALMALCSIGTYAQQTSLPADNIPNGATITITTADTVCPTLTNMTNPSGKYNYVRTIMPDVPLQTLPAAGIYDRVTTDYFDGLGRPLQTVGQKAHAEGNDIVMPHVYDALGREAYQYLPFAAPMGLLSNPGKMKLNVNTQLRGFYNQSGLDEQPYAKTTFENSPLNRVTKQMSPGKSWVGSGRGVDISYETNRASEVRLWTIGNLKTATPATAGYYTAGM